MESPKLDGRYETGQLFLHRVFGYRGVALFPWLASVYDRDVPDGTGSNSRTSTFPKRTEDANNSFTQVHREVKGRAHTYYQVLIDVRDCQYVRAQTESVTFLGNQENSRSLFAIPGLDYVAHEDVLPYTSVDRQPIQHELFDKFLMYDPDRDPPLSPRETLRAWQEKNHPWLELSDVYKETTENVRVTVIPFYMGCRVSQNTTVYWVCLHVLSSSLLTRVSLTSGGTAFDWRTCPTCQFSCEKGTGRYSVCPGLWKQCVDVESWVKNPFCPKASRPFSTVVTSVCTHPVATCGE